MRVKLWYFGAYCSYLGEVMRSLTRVALLGITVAVVSAAIFVALRAPKAPEPFRIGIMTPLTGDVASWGAMQRNSTEMALQDFNAAGGVHGHPVQVIYEDDQATPKTGVSAFTKLATVDKVPLIVGSPASGVTLAVAPIADRTKTVLLSSGSTATAVGNAGPYVFRFMPSDEMQSAIMAKWARELGFSKVAVLYVRNSWGKGLQESFEPAFKKLEGTITSSEGAGADDTDFRTVLTKIAGSNPDAIFAPLYTRAAGLMVRQAKELGLKIQILGADVYETPEFVEVAGEAANGVMFTRFGQYSGPEYQAFAKGYQERFKSEPAAYAGYCYDAIKIAFYALERLPPNQYDGPAIREQILKIRDFHGVTGLSDFNGQTSASGKTFDRIIVKDGKNVPWKQ
jgi:branched-chain amino acid transport system substrate-binding protein